MDGKLRDRAAGSKRHNLLHELGLLLLGDLGQNGVDLVAQGVALLQADGDADVCRRCGEAGVIVLERQVGQLFVGAADGKSRRLLGDVAVDRAALESGQQIGELRIGARLNVRNLGQSVSMECAGLSCDLRALEVSDRLGVLDIDRGRVAAAIAVAAAAAGEARHAEHDGHEDGYDSSDVCLHVFYISC